jgi:2-oxo-4-hydroxy-4-carboxy-5-ureidoimidazoline decarboxylase
MTIDEVNALDFLRFIDLLGGVYEKSPWVAGHVWRERPFRSGEELRRQMQLAVQVAGLDRQLTLLRAHPDLGTRAQPGEALGEFSSKEQQGAGLDQLTRDEHETLLLLNRQYLSRFGFPFIYAVRGSGRHDVLAALTMRLESSPDEEFAQALHEVHRIAGFRLSDLIEPQ